MARVLIVGATGLLGSEVAACARAAGHHVRALVRTASVRRARLQEIGCELIEGDLKDVESVARPCREVDVVISTANSMVSRRSGDSLETVDLLGSLDLVGAAARSGVRRFIYTSVSPQFQDNIPFIRYKHDVERAVRASGMEWFNLQPTAFMEIHTGPLGGWDIAHGKARIAGDGRTTVGYISVKDVAAFAVAAITHSDPNRDLPLAGPQPLSTLEAVRIAERVTRRKFQLQRVPLAVLKVARLVVQPFNPHLGSLLAMILAQAVTPLLLPSAPYGEFGVRATSFEDYLQAMSRRNQSLTSS